VPRHRTQPSQPSTLQPAAPASGIPLSPPRPEAGEHSPQGGAALVSQIDNRCAPASHPVVTANPSGRSRVAVSEAIPLGWPVGGRGRPPALSSFLRTESGRCRYPESGPVGWRQPARWAPYGRPQLTQSAGWRQPPKLTHPSPVTVMSIRACRPRLVTASHCPCAPPPHPAVSANTHPGNPPRGIQATAEPVSRPGGGRPVGESRAPPALSSFLDPDSGRPESQKSLTVARSPLGFAPPTCQVARLRCGPPPPAACQVGHNT